MARSSQRTASPSSPPRLLGSFTTLLVLRSVFTISLTLGTTSATRRSCPGGVCPAEEEIEEDFEIKKDSFFPPGINKMAWRCSSTSNEGLITNLRKAQIITTDLVEKAMRAVDRGNYAPSRHSAYEESRDGNGPIAALSFAKGFQMFPCRVLHSILAYTGVSWKLAGLFFHTFGKCVWKQERWGNIWENKCAAIDLF